MKLKVQNLAKQYNAGIDILADISFNANAGESIAVCGPSGSGKSTLLSIIGSLETPTSGSVLIDDQSLFTHMNLTQYRLEMVGFVFQFHNLLPQFTICENVELSMIPLGHPAKTRKRSATEILSLLGLEDRLNSIPAKLSGGERQRCAVARALVNNPKLILADEPTGNLNSENGEQVMKILLEWVNKCSSTLIISTHNMDIAAQTDRRIQIFDGRIIE